MWIQSQKQIETLQKISRQNQVVIIDLQSEVTNLQGLLEEEQEAVEFQVKPAQSKASKKM